MACFSPIQWATRRHACHARERTAIMGAPALEDRVDEGGQRRALAENQQESEQEDDEEHRHHPPELLPPQVPEELADDSDPVGGLGQLRHAQQHSKPRARPERARWPPFRRSAVPEAATPYHGSAYQIRTHARRRSRPLTRGTERRPAAECRRRSGPSTACSNTASSTAWRRCRAVQKS